jgi:site-specific DNA recombinase
MNRDGRALRLLSICRVSSNEQSEGYSLEMQDQANRDWARRKGHRIVDTVSYVETASKQKDRQRFHKIIQRICDDPAVNGAVFHKVDRACRNLVDLAMLEGLETDKDKRVFFSTQEFADNAAGRLSLGVMGIVARWYTDNLREEVNKGLRGKVLAGEYPHAPPYGYRRDKEDGRSIVPIPDEDRAENVRTVFRLMASGEYSIDTLREELLRRGVFFSQRTQRWTRSYLAKLLRHPFYIGKIRWRGQIYEGKHESLVDRETWEQVQKILDGRVSSGQRKQRRFTYGHQLIKCGYCGYSITAEVHKRQYTYYRCSQSRYQVDKHPAKLVWVREPIIESQVVDMLRKLCIPKEVYDWVMAYLSNVHTRHRADRRKELDKLKRKVSETQGALDAILMKAAETDDSLTDSFMRLARKKQQEVSILQRRMEQLKTDEDDNGREPIRIIELTQDLAAKYVTFPSPQKRQVVESVFSNLWLEDVNLCGEYRLPFSILAENGHRPSKYA